MITIHSPGARLGQGNALSYQAMADAVAGMQLDDLDIDIRFKYAQSPRDVLYLPDASTAHVVPLAIYSSTMVFHKRQKSNAFLGVSPTVVLHPIVDDMAQRTGGKLRQSDNRELTVGWVADSRASPLKGSRIFRQLKSRLEGRARFIVEKDKPYEKMYQFYAQCDLLIFPAMSRTRETYGRPIVEASSLGIPVLASYLPGTLETECAAEYVHPHEISDWEEAVVRWLDRLRDDERDVRDEARARFEAAQERTDDEIGYLRAALEDLRS